MSNLGQYFSVDSRPVSNNKGMTAKMAKMFMSYLRAGSGLAEKIVSPFICLNIVCPVGSYDPNIEPSKDDVLFTNTEEVMKTCESFFQSVYGVLSQGATDAVERTNTSRVDVLVGRRNGARDEPLFHSRHGMEESFKHSKASKSTDDSAAVRERAATWNLALDVTDAPLTDDTMADEEQSQRGWRTSILNDSDEAQLHEVEQNNIEDEAFKRDVSTLNPWTIAKLNAPVRRKWSENQAQEPRERVAFNEQLMTPIRERRNEDLRTSVRSIFSLQSSGKTYSNEDQEVASGCETPSNLTRHQPYHPATPLRHSRRKGLDSWVLRQITHPDLDQPSISSGSFSSRLVNTTANPIERPSQPNWLRNQTTPINTPFTASLNSSSSPRQRRNQERRQISLVAEGYQNRPCSQNLRSNGR